MKVAIVGSRNYRDLDAVIRYVDSLPDGTQIISGGARGVDRTAERAARSNPNLPWPIIFAADWQRFGKRAGLERNKTIVAAADRVVAFWDGESRGTAHTVSLARATGKPVEIIRP